MVAAVGGALASGVAGSALCLLASQLSGSKSHMQPSPQGGISSGQPHRTAILWVIPNAGRTSSSEQRGASHRPEGRSAQQWPWAWVSLAHGTNAQSPPHASVHLLGSAPGAEVMVITPLGGLRFQPHSHHQPLLTSCHSLCCSEVVPAPAGCPRRTPPVCTSDHGRRRREHSPVLSGLRAQLKTYRISCPRSFPGHEMKNLKRKQNRQVSTLGVWTLKRADTEGEQF